MPGLGTIVDAFAIVAGALIGRFAGKALPDRVQKTLLSACGVMTLFIGIGGVMQHMLVVTQSGIKTQGTMMMILSLIAGSVLGGIIDLEGKLEKFGVYLKEKSGNADDASFVNAFVTASLTVCIGAMAIVGSIEDGIYADHSILFTKSILDFVIIIAMASALGIGTAFSAIPVAILQGVVTLLARLAAPLMTNQTMSNLSYVGAALITCVGINLIFPRKVSVANMLPSLIFAVILAFIPGF
ncbi:MAG: DUF554 domain-containing protein [Lachnospiraceae bacterium]|jgi:uncharacterized membrane protein YqgA involved in biofilm formation